MAVIALDSAATGLSALSTEIDVIANNLANANTVGFKASRVNFQDLLYQQKAQPGVENENGDISPAGLHVGLGVKISNTQFDFSQGSATPGSGDLDMMIEGPGLFKVSLLPDQGDGVGYSRAGNFTLNRDGEVVLGNSEGPRLEPPIDIPEGTTNIQVSADGIVSGVEPGGVERTEFGQLELATFVNPSGLKPIGQNLFIETDGSGPPIEGAPGEAGFGRILHKFLESSNADPVKELVSLIKAQRAFEMNSQTIQAADQALQVIGNLRRF